MTCRSKVKKKKKRRTNKKSSDRLAPPSQPTDAAAVARGSPYDYKANDKDDDGSASATATDSQDEVIPGLKVNEGAAESETG